MSTRPTWETLPAEVRRGAEERFGARVAAARSQPGGFSPGLAERLTLTDGRRLFVKIVDAESQPTTAALHRREAQVLGALPASVPRAALRDAFDVGHHFVLVLEDLEGRHPETTETAAALDALRVVTSFPAPAGLRSARDEFHADFGAWRRLTTLPPAAAPIHDRVMAAAESLLDAVDGQSLTHLDARADNMLIDAYGRVRLIDWPWAAVGAPWIDPVLFLVDVLVRDADADVEGWFDHPALADAPDEHLDAILAGVAGSWYERAEQPSPPGMPTLRDFQRREADASIRLLRRRWDA